MNDPGVKVANNLYFYAALLQHNVPTQLFLYAEGGNAYDIHNRSATVQGIDPCIAWIKEMKWKKHTDN